MPIHVQAAQTIAVTTDRRDQGEREGIEDEDERTRDPDRDWYAHPLDRGLYRQTGALWQHLVRRR